MLQEPGLGTVDYYIALLVLQQHPHHRGLGHKGADPLLHRLMAV